MAAMQQSTPVDSVHVEKGKWNIVRSVSAPVLHSTAPHKAAAKGWTAIIGALSSVMQLDEADGEGWTPAHWAARRGQAASIEKLAECGASLELTLPGGATPAHLAAANGKVAALKALGKANARLDMRDEEDRTPAMLAAERGHVPCLVVLNNYVDLDSDVSPLGMTIAHVAVQHGQAAVLQALDALGCQQLQRQNFEGKTPAQLAEQLTRGSVACAAVVQVLKNIGAAPKSQPDHWKPRRRRVSAEEEETEPPKLNRLHRSLGAAAACTYSPGNVIVKKHHRKRTAGYSDTAASKGRSNPPPADRPVSRVSIGEPEDRMRIMTHDGYRDLQNAYESAFALAGAGGLDMGRKRASAKEAESPSKKDADFKQGPNIRYIWKSDA